MPGARIPVRENQNTASMVSLSQEEKNRVRASMIGTPTTTEMNDAMNALPTFMAFRAITLNRPNVVAEQSAKPTARYVFNQVLWGDAHEEVGIQIPA